MRITKDRLVFLAVFYFFAAFAVLPWWVPMPPILGVASWLFGAVGIGVLAFRDGHLKDFLKGNEWGFKFLTFGHGHLAFALPAPKLPPRIRIPRR